MNKNKAIRSPVPENRLARFMPTIWMIAEALGVDKIPSACHYLQLCGEEIDRHQFNANHQVSSNQRVNADRNKFIAVFKTKYLELTDREYMRPTDVEGRIIGQIIESLSAEGLTVDDFLKWFFDSFLKECPRFVPPTIKISSSRFVLEKFFYENRELVKQRKNDEIRNKEFLDLVNRGRALIRMSKTKEEAEVIKNILRNYRDGRIIGLDALRKLIVEQECIYAQKAASAANSAMNPGEEICQTL